MHWEPDTDDEPESGSARRIGFAKRIGVLALQGGFAAHARPLEELGHVTFEARTAREESVSSLFY